MLAYCTGIKPAGVRTYNVTDPETEKTQDRCTAAKMISLAVIILSSITISVTWSFHLVMRTYDNEDKVYNMSINPDGEVNEQINSILLTYPELQNSEAHIRKSVQHRIRGIQLKEKLGLTDACANLITDVDASILHNYVNLSLSSTAAQGTTSNEKVIYAETGSYVGCSSILMASMFPPGTLVYSHDLWVDVAGGERLLDDGLPPPNYIEEDNYFYSFYDNVRRRGLEHAVIPIRGDSGFTLGLHRDESVTFGFIDGDHSYEGVTRDLRAMFPKIRPGGVLLLHDVIYAGEYINDAARALIDFCSMKNITCDFMLDGSEMARVYKE